MSIGRGEKVSKVINHKHNYTYGDVPGLGECKCGNYRVFDRETQTYKEYEICLACSQSYPPNGILFCDECGEIHDEENEVMTIKEGGNK